MAGVYYPPPAFRFAVNLVGKGVPQPFSKSIDASFEEISGVEAKLETEDVVEGGENRFVHRLPKAVQSPPLVMKRGVVTTGSYLADWATDVLQSGLSVPIATRGLLVSLLDETGNTLVSWSFANAYPLRWATSALNAQENKILTETMEFSYSYQTRKYPGDRR